MLSGISGLLEGGRRKAAALAILAALATTGIAAYSAGRDRGAGELAVWRAASAVNLPAAAGDARAAAAELRQATAEFSALMATNQTYQAAKAETELLRRQNAELRAANEFVADALSSTRGDLQRAQAALSRTNPRDGGQILEVGLAPSADRGVLTVGLIGTYDSYSVLSINGGRYTVEAGENFSTYGTDGSRCAVSVVAAGPDRTSVTASCAGPTGP